jgi:SAM-dependent methyltransferase
MSRHAARPVQLWDSCEDNRVCRAATARSPMPDHRSPEPEPLSPHATRTELFKLFLSERDDPEPFYTKLAHRVVAEFPFPLRDRLVLDLGAGPGHYTAALEHAGARMVPVDLGQENMRRAAAAGFAAARADATLLPFPASTFEGVFCSNLLEHVPDVGTLINEIERVLRPRGWAWISWTNWYSPWGGHELVPFHFLGPDLAVRAYKRWYGRSPPRNAVYHHLFPTYIGRVLTDVRERKTLRVLDLMPRYYPSQRWVLRVPGLREVATWNCVMLVERLDERKSFSR